jgi:Asp-tRNA(Asn)/Glu-tRNA(Gln) amidotransferase A subunit family amidase
MIDLAVSFRVLSQPDPTHYLSRHFDIPRPLSPSAPRKRLLGICRPWFDRADPVVQEHCSSAIRYLTTELGYKTIDISIPLLQQGQLAHALTILSEALTATPEISHLTAPNRIMMSVARQTPASDWLLAQRVRNILMEHLAHLFREHPGLIIVTPTTPNAGWPINPGELTYGFTDANTQLRAMEYVWLANFTGVPCIQFPVGYAEPVKGRGEGKVPVGMCGHGEWGSEEQLIEFGFDGEKWIQEGYGGRKMPRNWVDVFEETEKRKV